MTTARTSVPPADDDTRPFAWFRDLGPRGRRAFAGAFGGWALDSYDYWVLPLGLAAVISTLRISTGQAGMLSTTTLVMSAVGGALVGRLADRFGRTRMLIVTVLTYAVFTVLCGFAPNYETLLVFRALQGFGFGGEWAVGAILVSEYARARHRGRTVAFVQSAWAIGWAAAVLVYTLVFSLVSSDLAWRVLFWTGALPAVLVWYLRRKVTDAPVATERRLVRRSFTEIWTGGLLPTTLLASLLATGAQGGYYTLATWLPAYLATDRGLSVVGTGSYLALSIAGAFTGYLTGGYLTDRLGRRPTFVLFAALSAAVLVAFGQIPAGADAVLLVLTFPLGFTASAIFSGFGTFLSELYPTPLRGTGQGFTYNAGRALGALFPAGAGFLAAEVGLGGAMAVGAAAYTLAAAALLGLPETRGRGLPDVEAQAVEQRPEPDSGRS